MRQYTATALLLLPSLAFGQGAAPSKPAEQKPAEAPAAKAPAPAAAPGAEHAAAGGEKAAPIVPGTDDWRAAEKDTLTGYVQLTKPDMFVRAGEAYFSGNLKWIIFQAVPVPEEGKQPDANYSMYIAKLKFDDQTNITGIETPILVSPPGSANTCGFFNPVKPWEIIFGSTFTAPAESAPAGYQRGTSSYRWAFPKEMDVATCVVPELLAGRPTPGNKPPRVDPELSRPHPLLTSPGYTAECSFDPTGRYVVMAAQDVNVESGGPRPQIDIDVYDTQAKTMTHMITAAGYNGGPFFSADGKWICYRSDRKGNDMLQLYIAEVQYDHDETLIMGAKREIQLTDDENVNWGPFWCPSGEYLVYATSAVGHDNYEVFTIQTPIGANEGKKPGELKKKRITYAAGFDGLPVFSRYAEWMMWTSQRGGKSPGQEKASSQIWVARPVNIAP